MKKLVMICSLSLLLELGLGAQADLIGHLEHHHIDDLGNPYDIDQTIIYKTREDEIKLVKFTDATGQHFCVAETYTWSDWRFMDGKILIKADDKLFKLEDPHPRQDMRDGGVREMIIADIEKEAIEAMAKASVVRIQVFHQPLILLDQGREAIKDFYDNVVASTSQ